MKKMIIFDPAMCCSTGVCGPSVNPELLRISTILNNLKNKGIIVERYNLTNNSQAFIDNKEVNSIILSKGIEALPVIVLNGQIIKVGSYPSNDEFCTWLGVPSEYLKAKVKRSTGGCGCKGGCC